MSRDQLIESIVTAIRSKHGFSQHGVGETVMEAIDACAIKIGFDPDQLQAAFCPATVKETLTADLEDQVWYWVLLEPVGNDQSRWVPAMWEVRAKAFYSWPFSGIPARALSIGPKLIPPSALSL